MVKGRTIDTVQKENEELRGKLQEMEETLSAIRNGEIDAIVTTGPQGEQIYTLKGADYSYRVFIETMNEAAATLTSSGVVVYCNKSFSQLLNVPLEKLTGRQLTHFISPQDVTLFQTLLSKGLRSTVREELNIQNVNGKIIPILLSSGPLQIDTAELCIVLTDLRQIKEAQKQLQKAHDELEQKVEERTAELKKSMETTEKLIQYAPTAIYEIDFQGPRFKSVNEAMCRLSGYSEDELFCLSPLDLLDAESQKRFKERIKKGLTGESIEEKVEYTVLVKDGRKLSVVLNIKPTYKDGKLDSALVIGHDITERKKSEQKLVRQAQVLNQVQDGIIVADPEFRITYWNSGAEHMFGYSQAESLGKTTQELLRPIYAPGEREKIIDELNRSGSSINTIRTKDRNGTEIIAAVRSTQIKDKTGNISGYVVTYRDVTDREKAVAALREAEFKYRTVANNTYDFEFWIDPNGKFLYASPSCKRITGYKTEDFLKDPALRKKIVYPGDHAIFDHHIHEEKKYIAGEAEYRIVHKDGSIQWISHVCQPVYDRKGRYLGFRGSNRRTTERKLIEGALRESEERLRLAQNCANVGIWDWNIQTNDLFFTPELNQLYGLAPGSIKTYQDWRNLTHLDDIERIETERDIAITNHQPFDLEFRILHRSGEIRWINAKGGAFYEKDGKAVRVLGVNIDITERKKTEEELRETRDYLDNLLNYANAPIIVWDGESRIIKFNHAFEHLTGYTPNDVIGKNLHMLFPDLTREASLKKIEKTLSGEYWESVEIPILRKDGITRIALWNSANIYNKTGNKLIATIAQGQDITERKQTEKALKTSEETAHAQAQKLQTVLDTTPAIIWIAHDCKCLTITGNRTSYELLRVKDSSNVSKSSSVANQMRHYDVYKDGKKLKPQEMPMQLVAATGKPLNDYEFDIVFDDGMICSLLGNVTPILDSQGQPDGAVGAFLNITEHKQASEKLRETHDYLDNLLNYANAPIIVWDKNFKIMKFNHAFEHLTGYTSNEVVDKKLSILFPNESQKESIKKINQTLRGEYWESVEIPILRKDGNTRTALWNSANIYDKERKTLLATIAQGQDITERKIIENMLKESENRLNKAQEIADLGSWELDLLNNHLTWSDEVYRIFGLKPQEFDPTYEAFLTAIHPNDRAAVDNAYTRSLREGRNTYEIEHRIVKKNGEIRFVHEKCEHIRNESGKTIRSIGMIHDITERKQAEAELIRLASFPQKNPNPIAEIDLSGKIQYLNPSSQQFFPEMENKGCNHQFLKGIKNLIPDLQKKGKNPIVREVKINDSYYLQTITYIPENQRIRIYSTDITERKQMEEELQKSEEKYRKIVENTTNVIMATQPDGIISYLSPSCKEILGYSPDELIGTNPIIFHPNDVKKVKQVLSKALKGEKGSGFEYRILTKQGEIKWISHSWAPIFLNKKLQSIVSVIADITERKTVEDKIKKLNESLMHRSIELGVANKELESFSYSVSHDLRAPLRSIDGFSQALSEDYADILDEQGKEYIQRVRNATQRMGQLIDDMLRLSRLTRAEMTIKTVDLGQEATTIMGQFKKEDPTRKIDFLKHGNLIGEGDTNLLHILLENMLGNAWKFTKKRKRAEIEFGKTQQGQETVFFIRDNGAGFNMKYANKLFIPFQRLHDDTDYPGTGIGLSIVSRIIHRHGGRIWAEAEEEKGATFYFTLGGKTNE